MYKRRKRLSGNATSVFELEFLNVSEVKDSSLIWINEQYIAQLALSGESAYKRCLERILEFILTNSREVRSSSADRLNCLMSRSLYSIDDGERSYLFCLFHVTLLSCNDIIINTCFHTRQ